VLIVTALAAALVVAGSVAATARVTGTSNRILQGVRIDGVDVGGMTREQALDAVRRHVAPALHSKLTVVARGRRFEVTPSRLGRRPEVAQTVDRALDGPRLSWPADAWYRTTGRSVDYAIPVGYSDSSAQVASFVDAVAARVDTRARDASIRLVDGKLQVRHAHTGWAVDRAAGERMVAGALAAGRSATIALPVRRQRPRTADADAGMTITIDLTANRLTLYQSMKVVKRYPVATGQAGFPTPTGTWKVMSKIVNPSWHNPAPNGWGAGAPLVIPPGPGNPLGTRALALNAAGILIHGSYASGSIGSYASHGCIRMHIWDAEELYPRVPVGSQVLIFWS
jgi:lipoprotein-anchoring transpeptidase ErfK/SrfK